MENIKLIITLGPSTRTEADLHRLKAKGVDFVRINMSHSGIEDLLYFISIAKKAGLPFILDTEGSQIRTGLIAGGSVFFAEGAEVLLSGRDGMGDDHTIVLKPPHIIAQLEPGDLVHADFDSLILRVTDTSRAGEGFVAARAIVSGRLGNNKAVVIDPVMPKTYDLPALSNKDYQSIAIGLREGVEYIAASFMRSGFFVDEVRKSTAGKMKIISKIECKDALNNLDDIIERSDAILIDRGDLSKEIPIEKIPLAQKIIMSRSSRYGVPVYVATNLLETMVEKLRPTRAEVHDVVSTVLDGASGVALSAETAIGKHPVECVAMMQKILKEAAWCAGQDEYLRASAVIAERLGERQYLHSKEWGANLIAPHGGALVDRVLSRPPSAESMESMPKIVVDEMHQMDAEQIATGAFSPLEGFMGRRDLECVLESMRLSSGDIWPVPIVLDVSADVASKLTPGLDAILSDNEGGAFAVLHVEEAYPFDKESYIRRLFGTTDSAHSGVRQALTMHPFLVAGKIDLFRRRVGEFSGYALTPRQVRRLFSERHWSRVVGFHTRNVIHRSHEYIQLKALEDEHCDGLFVHPVIGRKKPGDYQAKYILQSYERMMNGLYPENKVVFATFNTYSRYAGPREALFTAICRQNFGCSHFVVGRDHTGVGSFYPQDASHKIFDEFPDLKIKSVRFGEVFYSRKAGGYKHAPESHNHDPSDKLSISGTEARRMFKLGRRPPAWFMRPEISGIVLSAVGSGEEVFVPDEKRGIVAWFTGLSGSGKSTVAEKLKEMLEARGKRVLIIDGDAVRSSAHKHLGFSREDIRENNRLIAEQALEKSRDYDFVLVPVISPYRADRAEVRKIVGGGFVEVFVKAPIETCMARDPKGLYRKALGGEIPDFIGVSASNPYEPPLFPDFLVDTELMDVHQSSAEVVKFLMSKI